MRKFLTIALVALSTAFGAGMAEAQVRPRPYLVPGVSGQKLQLAPRARTAPRVQGAPRVKQVRPKVNMLPPSAALKRALGVTPNAKALGVTLDGPLYIVKLRQGGTITKLGVNSVTGAVTRLP
jgi:hypothetical protein